MVIRLSGIEQQNVEGTAYSSVSIKYTKRKSTKCPPSTQKACAGVDTWLSKASTATIEGNVMKVKDSNGKVIGGLEKEDK